MKISSRSILSPGRTDKFQEPTLVLSSSRSTKLRGNGSIRRGQSSPMFPTCSKKKGCAFETQEPTSPKVTCIGQVRVKSKKQSRKKMKSRSMKSRDAMCLRRNEKIHEGISQDDHFNGRNHKWVHFSLAICEALKGFGSEFKCFHPCGGKTFCTSNMGCEKEKEERGLSSCGKVFAKWLADLQEKETLTEDEIEKREETMMEKPAIELIEEEVPLCIPPKNALLLMRCRSEPYRCSSLASRSWDSSLIEVDVDVKEDYNRESGDEGEGEYCNEVDRNHEKFVKMDDEEPVSSANEQSHVVDDEGKENEECYLDFESFDDDIDQNLLVSQNTEKGMICIQGDETNVLDEYAEGKEEEICIQSDETDVLDEYAERKEEEVCLQSDENDVLDEYTEGKEEEVCLQSDENDVLHEYAEGKEKEVCLQSAESYEEAQFVKREEMDDSEPFWSEQIEDTLLQGKTEDNLLQIKEAFELHQKEEEPDSLQLQEGRQIGDDEEKVSSVIGNYEEKKWEVAGYRTGEMVKEDSLERLTQEGREVMGEGLEENYEEDSTKGTTNEEKNNLLLGGETKPLLETSKGLWFKNSDSLKWHSIKPVSIAEDDRRRASADSISVLKYKSSQPISSMKSTSSLLAVSPFSVMAATPFGPFVLPRCKSEPVKSSVKLAPEACFWKNSKIQPPPPPPLGVGGASGYGF